MRNGIHGADPLGLGTYLGHLELLLQAGEDQVDWTSSLCQQRGLEDEDAVQIEPGLHQGGVQVGDTFSGQQPGPELH